MSSLNEQLCPSASTDRCLTKLEVKEYTCEWAIEHFSLRGETGDKFVESSIFPAGAANDEPKWSVRVYPAKTTNLAPYVALEIISHSNSNEDAKFKISILNEKRKMEESIERSFIFCEQNKKSFDDLIRRDRLLNRNDLLPQDTLTLLLEVRVAVYGSSVNIHGESNIAQFEDPNHKLSEDFRSLLDNKEFTDITLAVGAHELKAHKSVLAARSKVFADKFKHEMEEQNLNRISITDIDHIVLEQMLHYMYTDKAPKLDTMAEDLLAAADKYALKNLKVMCEESLRINISVENAAYTLILADRHNAVRLKSKTIDFIIRNATSVMETQGFKDMITTHSHLIADAFYASASKQFPPTEPPCKKKLKFN